MNKILKIIQKEFVYGGHLFALGAISVALMCIVLFNFQNRWDFIIVIFLIFGVVFIYCFSFLAYF